MSGGFQYNNPRHHAPTFKVRPRVFEDEMSSAPTMDGDEPSVLAPLPPMQSFHASAYGPSSHASASSPSHGNRANSSGGSRASGNSPGNRPASNRSYISHQSRNTTSSKPYSTPLPPMPGMSCDLGSNDGPSFGGSHPGMDSTYPAKSVAKGGGEGQEVDLYTQPNPGRKNKILLLVAVGCMILVGAVIGAMFALGVFNGGDSKTNAGVAQKTNALKQNASDNPYNKAVPNSGTGDGDSTNDAQVDATETEETGSTEGDSTSTTDSNENEAASSEGTSGPDTDANIDTVGVDTDTTIPDDTSDGATEINDFMNEAGGDGTDDGEGGLDFFDIFGDGGGVEFYSGPLTTDSPTYDLPPAPSPPSPTYNSNQGTGYSTAHPTASPTTPRLAPVTDAPTKTPVSAPITDTPTKSPVSSPVTDAPTRAPVPAPTYPPVPAPTNPPTREPTSSPTREPTSSPTREPTSSPTVATTASPTAGTATSPPTSNPTNLPTDEPTQAPIAITVSPTSNPTKSPEDFQSQGTSQVVHTKPPSVANWYQEPTQPPQPSPTTSTTGTAAPTEGDIIRRRVLRAQYEA